MYLLLPVLDFYGLKLVEFWISFQVMTVGQRVTFEYHGVNYIYTVTEASVERRDKSDDSDRGVIVDDTYIVFEAANSSGIKVNLCSF